MGEDRIICNASNRVLRLKQYLKKVGTPPPHNLVILTSPETRKNSIKRVEYEYKVNDKVIINNKYAYKYKTLYMRPYKTRKLGPKVWPH